MSPICKGTCMVGGEKAYNEMIRVVDLDAKTYFRVGSYKPSHKALPMINLELILVQIIN